MLPAISPEHSVNRLNAQVKLLEVWKTQNLDNYPLEIKKQEISESIAATRAASNGRLREIGRSVKTQNSAVSDAIRIWNLAPDSITKSKTLYQAKNAIKSHIVSLPL